MQTVEDARPDPSAPPGPLRKAGQILSWIFAALFLLAGLIMATQGSTRLMALGLLLAGLLLLPPVSGLIRKRTGLLWPVWTSPVIAVALVMISTVATSMTTTREQVQAESKASAARGAASDAANAAKAAAKTQARIDAYTKRVTTRTIPQIEALTTESPMNMAALEKAFSVLNEGGWDLERGKDFGDDPAARAAILKLRTVLAAKQTAILPVLRGRYAGLMSAEFRPDNTDVNAVGAGGRIMRVTGFRMAANRGIDRVKDKVWEKANQLRFTELRFEWYRGSDYNSHDLRAPSDSALGHWSGSTFYEAPPAPGSKPKAP